MLRGHITYHTERLYRYSLQFPSTLEAYWVISQGGPTIQFSPWSCSVSKRQNFHSLKPLENVVLFTTPPSKNRIWSNKLWVNDYKKGTLLQKAYQIYFQLCTCWVLHLLWIFWKSHNCNKAFSGLDTWLKMTKKKLNNNKSKQQLINGTGNI